MGQFHLLDGAEIEEVFESCRDDPTVTQKQRKDIRASGTYDKKIKGVPLARFFCYASVTKRSPLQGFFMWTLLHESSYYSKLEGELSEATLRNSISANQ